MYILYYTYIMLIIIIKVYVWYDYCRTGIIRRLGGAIVEPMIRDTSSWSFAAAAAV